MTKAELRKLIKEAVEEELVEQHSPDKQRFPTVEEKKATRKLVYDMVHRLRDIADQDDAWRATERIMDEISLAAEEHPSVKDQAVEALMLAADQRKWQKVLSFLVNYVPGDAAQHIIDRCLSIVEQFDAKDQKSFDFQSAELEEQRYMTKTSPQEVAKSLEYISREIQQTMQGVNNENIMDNLARAVEQFGQEVGQLMSWVKKNKR